MASSGSEPADKPQARLSFAKVAASSYKPPKAEEPPNAKTVETHPQSRIQNHNEKLPLPVDGNPEGHASVANGDHATEKTDNTENGADQWASFAGQQASSRPDAKEYEAEKLHPGITLVRSMANEDSATQLSSSDGSAKPASLDGKSVASATTFALDEKESIRPDDSASLRAVEEEDVTSPPDSVAAGSRVGSDSGIGRAFRDQLHEIAVMGPRGAPPGRFPVPHSSSPHALYDPNQPPNGIGRSMLQPVANGLPSMTGQHALPDHPDEKLIEALESPRDRLFVLKLEQDFIDFIKDSQDPELLLPNCNTFYRMLAHRLADYYLLGHMVDQTNSGVKISRTSHCRIPPPLSGLPISSKNTNTPPVDLPARKIMRRDDGKSGTNTAANSEGPSKTTSEAGGASGSDGGNDGNDTENKEKASLTREEREARYRAARQRIFGSADPSEGDPADAVGSGEEKDVSRSSSTSGRKKTKKQRNYDDDFEARSRFNPYYPSQYPMGGFGGDQTVYYAPYNGQMPNQQFAGLNTNMPSSTNYGAGYPGMDTQAQYGWPSQQYTSPNMPMNYANYNSTQSGYDLSADFQRGMSFQPTALPTQMTPKMANAPMAPYQDPYQAQPMAMNGGWSPMNQQNGYSGGQMPYSPTSSGNRPMSAPMQGAPPGQYPYGQLPSSPYNGISSRNQHPLPGSFNRQQFNPQSQAFVPGGCSGPYQMQANMAVMASQGMNGYSGTFQSPTPMMPNSPPVAHSQTYGSPQGMQNSMSSRSHSVQSTTSQGASGAHGSSQLNSSVPAQSSIAKWGTPSHLPPRPPAPAQQQAPKFGNNNFPSLPRPPNNMA